MSFWVDLTDLASITPTPGDVDVGLLAWHEGQVLPPIIIFRASMSDPWQLRTGGGAMRLTDFRAEGRTQIVAHDDSRNNP